MKRSLLMQFILMSVLLFQPHHGVVGSARPVGGDNGLVIILDRVAVVEGFIRDGLSAPRDSLPDYVVPNSVVQVLDTERIYSPFEDRGILEFDVSQLVLPISLAELELTVYASEGPYPFTVGIYSFAGDGKLSLDDFNEGTFVATFEYSGEPVVKLDVTSIISDAVAAGESFMGLRFQYGDYSAIEMNGPFVAFDTTTTIDMAFPERLGKASAAVIHINVGPSLGFDINPGVCPNVVNSDSTTVISAAILGTERLDATVIEPASVALRIRALPGDDLLSGTVPPPMYMIEVFPLDWRLEDISSPTIDDSSTCAQAQPDGILDLSLGYSVQKIVAALGSARSCGEISLEVTGRLKDAWGKTTFEGKNAVQFVCGVIMPIPGKNTGSSGVTMPVAGESTSSNAHSVYLPIVTQAP